MNKTFKTTKYIIYYEKFCFYYIAQIKIEMTTISCSYVGCKKRFAENKSTTTFFKFPVKDKERCKKWILHCGNSELLNVELYKLEYRKVCSDHFDENSFSDKNSRKRLLKTAVPFRFDDEDFTVNIPAEVRTYSATRKSNITNKIFIEDDASEEASISNSDIPPFKISKPDIKLEMPDESVDPLGPGPTGEGENQKLTFFGHTVEPPTKISKPDIKLEILDETSDPQEPDAEIQSPTEENENPKLKSFCDLIYQKLKKFDGETLNSTQLKILQVVLQAEQTNNIKKEPEAVEETDINMFEPVTIDETNSRIFTCKVEPETEYEEIG